MGDIRIAYKNLIEKTEGKKPLARYKMDFKEIGWEVVDWIHLAQGKDQWQALVNAVMKLLVP
jgi:hypothetical protein